MNAVARNIAAMLALVWFGVAPVKAGAPPRLFDGASWAELVRSHKGRPVIVHFWGFSCGNCMVEMRDWGRFAKEHPGAVIAFVNWDRHGADPTRIENALANAGLADVESYTLAGGFEEKLRFAVDRDWMGELPYTRRIAPDGSVTTFSGAADFGGLSRWLGAVK